MPVFVNRTLNLKKIQMIGFDMDYTLVAYHTKEFEKLVYTLAKERLQRDFSYPKELQRYEFDFYRSIVGLVIDLKNGYLLQLSRYGKVKSSYFGLDPVPFRKQNAIYQNIMIDLRDQHYKSLDTLFAISSGVLFSQLVQLKKEGVDLPEFTQLDQDITAAIDSLHMDGSLKDIIKNHFEDYVIRDPKVPRLLERYLDYNKKLMIITNSDYSYTKELLDYAINPYLQNHSRWQELFEVVITFADKPHFFQRSNRFLRIDPDTGLMRNHEGPITPGIYQGGGSTQLQRDLNLQGNEILYLGDHIYGDVVSIKKSCDWRTALVLADLEREMEGIKNSYSVQKEIDSLMERKAVLEQKINQIDIERYERKKKRFIPMDALFKEMDEINTTISELLGSYLSFFNPYWGEILRAGSEESRYADQVERFACIYMTKVSDLYDYSPRTYFRPTKRILPHEQAVIDSIERSES
ncbi:MAG: HAD-IG family 5'-nucleotidase [Spirochaetota bacterium]